MKSLLSSDAYREIYLVFMSGDYPFSYLFKQGFQHVYAIERQNIGWLCLDPSCKNLFNVILPALPEADVIATLIENNPSITVLPLKVRPNAERIYPKFGVVSCVSVMKYLLGIHSWSTLTPYQLYIRLKKNNIEHIEVS